VVLFKSRIVQDSVRDIFQQLESSGAEIKIKIDINESIVDIQ